MTNVHMSYVNSIIGLPDYGRENYFQKTYLGSSYAYSIERNNNDNTKSDIYRGHINDDNTISYNKNDYMAIHDGGHSQTLELCKPNGLHPEFLVALNANKNKNDPQNHYGANIKNPKFYFGTQLGLISYNNKYSNNFPLSISSASSICNLCFGLSDDIVSRVDAGITPDKHHLVVLARNPEGDTQFSLINTRELLNELSNGNVDASQSDSIKNYFPIYDFYGKLPNNSMQGVDMDNNYHIFISSGDSKHGQTIITAPWSFFREGYWNDGNHSFNVNYDWGSEWHKAEPEGVQTRVIHNKNYVYLSYYIHDNNKRYKNRIYRINESEFGY